MKKQLISQLSIPSINNSKIALDTNVLLWTFYDRINASKSYQKNIYPLFVDKALNGNNQLFTSIYNILEAFSIIENTEYDLYLNDNSLDKDTFKKKDYRKLLTEREKVKNTISLFFEQVKEAITILDNQISEKDLIEFYDTYTEQLLDSNDFAFIKICNQNKLNYLVTDDVDFGSYEGKCTFQLITGNANFVQI